MTRKIWMLTGAGAVALAGGAVLAPMAHANATPDPIPAANSYADLLEPVPDAMARIHADDAMGAVGPRVVQTGIEIGINLHHHHHHHHSAGWYRGHGYFWNGQVWVLGPPPPPPYWHHHHADWYRSNGYVWNGRIWARPAHHHHHHHHWR